MTLDELKASDRLWVTAANIEKVYAHSQQAIRMMARAGKLPFKVQCVGTRVSILRKSFLEWMEELEE